MRKIIAVLLCGLMLIFLSGNVFAQRSEKSEYADLFKKDSVIDIEINVDEADLADMRDNPKNEEYHAADITVDGITVPDSGLRTKGNMTLSSVADMEDSDRYSYRIKFNKYVKGQKLLGLNELCLNCGFSDASYMREYLSYEIMKAMGLNVPETVFCNVYINDEYAGFYLAVEALDSSYAETEFNDADEIGNLYKMEEGSSLVYKEDENYTYADLKVGKDTQATGLKKMIKALNEMPEGEKGDIENYLSVESALKYIAANTVLTNYDSYNNSMCHNYYLYEDRDGVFTVIPWDFNMSFGGRESDTTIGVDTPVSGGNIDNLPLIKNLLAVPEYKELYYGYIKEMMSYLEAFEDRVNELKTIIKPYVEKDTTAFYTIEEFEKATSKSGETTAEAVTESKALTQENPKENPRRGGGGFGNSISIVDCAAARLENLKAQFDGTAEKTTISNGGGFGGGFPGVNFERPQGGGRSNNGQGQGGDMPQMPDNFEMPEGFEPPANIGPNSEEGRRPDGNFVGPQGGGFGRNETDPNAVIRVHIDGHIIAFNENPVLSDGITLVGYRSVMEGLGAQVIWDEKTQTVTATKGDTTIVLTIGSDTAYVNGQAQSLLKAPEVVNGSTMVPVRFISEQLGMNVKWYEDTRLIEITSKK